MLHIHTLNLKLNKTNPKKLKSYYLNNGDQIMYTEIPTHKIICITCILF